MPARTPRWCNPHQRLAGRADALAYPVALVVELVDSALVVGLDGRPDRRPWSADCLQQQRRGIIFPAGDVGELGPNEARAGTLVIAERPTLGDGQQIRRAGSD